MGDEQHSGCMKTNRSLEGNMVTVYTLINTHKYIHTVSLQIYQAYTVLKGKKCI